MPEGDTVWRTAHRLDAALAGAVLTRWDLRWPSLATSDLRGATTVEVLPRGKHLLHRLDCGLTLHSHLRMEGQWRVAASGGDADRQARRPDVRAVLGTEDWTAIGLRLGMLDLVPTRDEGRHVGHLGPDILDPAWGERLGNIAVANLRAHGGTLGSALLDQRSVAGIGTMWAAEGLFIARLPPWDPPRAHLEALPGLLERVHTLMSAGLREAIPSSTGIHREGRSTYVHARSGRPCLRCGDTVRVASIGEAPTQRVLFYCPTCQGGLAPHDDGRPIRPLGAGRRPGAQPRLRKP
ncbi:putative enzyme [Nostocoides japonicum T1-X7]|uniref:DNA-(apurinic or apyrimidinic site) lyase n=1 Tax=Nostocoides japonicum T1-X7 TaxID=1194083 RepID=A0A077LWE5_9MICO|nr:DNA-formamidopyrimidine glycosylase family protein [Tetrasphaera japonica]CCH76319.1 putative enzyme [Tetrasphaera japonica T1-X7]